MKVGTENKKQLYTAGALGFVALLAMYPLYNTFFGGPDTPPPQAAPVIRDVTPGGAAAVRTGSATPGKGVSAPPGAAVRGTGGEAVRLGPGGNQLDPTLHMEAMLVTESLRYSGSGRNIFTGEAPAPPVKKVEVVLAKYTARQPAPPPPPPPPGPPPKPPINLKFFGTETNSAGVRRAFLLNGDDVFLAVAGDVVQRRYRVISIASNSIQVEDIPNENKQTLPLVN